MAQETTVRRILDEIGFKNVLVVKEQELPDSEFSTVKHPIRRKGKRLSLPLSWQKKKMLTLS